MIKLLFKSIVIGTFFSFFLLILGTLVIFGYASSHLPYQLSLSVASMPIALVEFTKDGFRFKFFLTGLLTLLTVFTLLHQTYADLHLCTLFVVPTSSPGASRPEPRGLTPSP